MNQDEVAELREYYDTHSTADDMDRGEWETDVDPNPMVTTSLRLPKDLLDWVREQAAVEQVTPSALIRRWVERRRGDGVPVPAGGVEQRLERLEHAVFAGGRGVVPEPKTPRD